MSKPRDHSFEPYLARWRLTPDGAPVATRSSSLLPVVTGAGEPAMLKIAVEPEEQRGAALMAWWAGTGAARVLAHDGDALLLERAGGRRDLTAMARGGRDDEATGILCGAAAALHAPRGSPPPLELVPLDRWFSGLWPTAERHGGLLARCAAVARELLSAPQEVVVLHGDIHHGNVLDFGSRGWLAIDPKGLIGERGFDYANLLCNPEPAFARQPGRLARQAGIASQAAGLDRRRLLSWVLAWAGLSAVWMAEDGDTQSLDLSMLEIAAAELGAA